MNLFHWLIILLTCTLANAQKYLKTDTLLTCMESSEFTAELFQVYFYPDNSTIVFNIDGSSSIAGDIYAEINLVVYGLNVYTEKFDLCSLDYSTVCPITSGRITVEGTYTIKGDITNQIPGVAYTIPDLDAYVHVLVYYNTDTNQTTPLACLKSVISNGKTVQTRYAGWPIAAVSGFGLVVSSFISIMGQSTTASHIASNAASLFIYFQNLAIMATMGVALMPPIAASWAQNFMWTLGIIETDFMQDIFFWYVQSTGGEVTSTLENKSVMSISVQKLKHLFKRAISVASATSDDVLNDSTLYTTDQYDISDKTLVLRGMQRVSYLANIEISNLFLTSITFFFFIGLIFIILISVFRGICEILIRSGSMNGSKFMAFRQKWDLVTKGALFRYFSITAPQLVLMCIWEFTQNNSKGCLAFAVLIFLVTMVIMTYSTVMILIKGTQSISQHQNAARLLFGDEKTLYKFGFLYSQYRAANFYWVSVSFGYLFIRALLIGVLQSQGKICACLIFAIEIIHTAVVCWIRPYLDKSTNIMNIFIAVVNLINSIFFMFYSNVFGQPPVVSSVAAIVYFILNAVLALILLIFTIVTCTIALLHKNPDSRYSQVKDDRNAFIPKEAAVDGDEEMELAALGATAMQGQDRKSYMPDSAEGSAYDSVKLDSSNTDFFSPADSTSKFPQSNTKVISTSVDNSRAELNPFDANDDDDDYDDSVSYMGGNNNYNLSRSRTDNSYGVNPFKDSNNIHKQY